MKLKAELDLHLDTKDYTQATGASFDGDSWKYVAYAFQRVQYTKVDSPNTTCGKITYVDTDIRLCIDTSADCTTSTDQEQDLYFLDKESYPMYTGTKRMYDTKFNHVNSFKGFIHQLAIYQQFTVLSSEDLYDSATSSRVSGLLCPVQDDTQTLEDGGNCPRHQFKGQIRKRRLDTSDVECHNCYNNVCSE